MKILYVCHRFPFPPKRGGKIRPFNMIRHLTQQGHEVWVASLARSEQESNECDGIGAHCHKYTIGMVSEWQQWAKMIVNLPLVTPSSMGYFHSSELKRTINEWLTNNRFDAIFVHCSSVAQYVEQIEGIPKILDFGDMDSQKWLTYKSFKPFPLNMGYWWEGMKMERAERALASKFDMCTATTKAELETLNALGTAKETDWFPNGVDSEYFKPDGEAYEPNSISFIGRMDYFPNQQCMIEFCDRTFPLIRKKLPDAKLYIVGAEPSARIKSLEEIEGVTVTGSVPDVRPYIMRTAAMVAPLNIARGTQNKILEAMAMGVPVVSSTLAAGGIDALPNEHFLIADTPDTYAHQLLSLMESPELRDRFAQAGRERVLSHHNWQDSMTKMESLIVQSVRMYKNKPIQQA